MLYIICHFVKVYLMKYMGDITTELAQKNYHVYEHITILLLSRDALITKGEHRLVAIWFLVIFSKLNQTN